MRRSRRRAPRPTALTALAALALSISMLTACGSVPPGATDRGGAESSAGSGGAAGRHASTGSDGPEGTVTVLAAASLTEAFDTIKGQVQAAHPGLDIEISYGSSTSLVGQVNQGAPADVIALAGAAAAEPLDPGLVRSTDVFATNVLQIAVPPDNPGHVTGLSDLARPGLRVVLCVETAPCGRAAGTTLEKAGVVASVVSRELDVKATLAKVRLGEADAAIVYRSDVLAARGAVTGIAIPDAVNTTLRYPIIRLDDRPATRAFVAAVLGSAGRAALASAGFGVVGPP